MCNWNRVTWKASGTLGFSFSLCHQRGFPNTAPSSPALRSHQKLLSLQGWSEASPFKASFFPLDIPWQTLSLGLEQIPSHPWHPAFSSSMSRSVFSGFECIQHTAFTFIEQIIICHACPVKVESQKMFIPCSPTHTLHSTCCSCKSVTPPSITTWSRDLSTSYPISQLFTTLGASCNNTIWNANITFVLLKHPRNL